METQAADGNSGINQFLPRMFGPAGNLLRAPPLNQHAFQSMRFDQQRFQIIRIEDNEVSTLPRVALYAVQVRIDHSDSARETVCIKYVDDFDDV